MRRGKARWHQMDHLVPIGVVENSLETAFEEVTLDIALSIQANRVGCRIHQAVPRAVERIDPYGTSMFGLRLGLVSVRETWMPMPNVLTGPPPALISWARPTR